MLTRIYHTRSILLMLLLLAVAGSGCKKFLDIPPPPTLVTSETLFSDDQTATAAMNGVYSEMMISNLFFANSGFTLMPGLSADELMRTSPDFNLDPFVHNQIGVDNFYNDAGLWKKGYEHIYQANAILEGLLHSGSVSQQTKNELTGEAKFVRAFCYFYLVNLFGDVPWINSTDYAVNTHVSRVPVAEIYDEIVADLKEAQALLGDSYAAGEKIRPNKFAALALLARVYLFQNKWPEAEEVASQIIDSNIFTLTNLDSVFLANSPEAIWQLMPVLSFLNTADGFAFIPYADNIQPPYIVSDYLLNSFEPGDRRKTEWLGVNIVDTKTFYYPYKYKVQSGTDLTEYNMVFRLAEQLLIRAEARAQQNNIPGALEDLNQVRARAGVTPVFTTDAATVLTTIYHENQVEFFVENGHRWLDLNRTGQATSVLAAEKPGWQPSDALYPIPRGQLEANPNLSQNPGY